jgi:hypothetical protein
VTNFRIILLLAAMSLLSACASTSAGINADTYQRDAPDLPFDPHPEQPGTFTNRTYHTTLSD